MALFSGVMYYRAYFGAFQIGLNTGMFWEGGVYCATFAEQGRDTVWEQGAVVPFEVAIWWFKKKKKESKT